MTSTEPHDIPLFYRNSLYAGALSMQDLGGLLKTHFRQEIKAVTSFRFSDIDQAFLVWGALTLAIFSLAQFSQLNWTVQAIIDAALTGIGIAGTAALTWQIATEARLRWVISLWAILMTTGMVITAWGIFGSVAWLLVNLCPLWLGLCVIGYGWMAVVMRSRAFATACTIHIWAIVTLGYHPAWQFLNSGLIMGLTLFFFSIVPWDMHADST